jgi:hypothetical protein
MPTQRKLVKGKKNRKITKRNKHTLKFQSGGAEPSKNKNKNDNEIDMSDDLFNDNDFDEEDKSAKTGAYNNNEDKELTGLAKQLQETQGGLSFQYPGPLNITQEQALKDKLNNVREEGFPGLEMKAIAQFKPKINYKKMYETDLLSSILVIPINEFDIEANNNKSSDQLEVEQME